MNPAIYQQILTSVLYLLTKIKLVTIIAPLEKYYVEGLTLGKIRPNRIKHKLERGEVATVVGGELTADMIEMLGPFGFDGVWVESEHGPIDFGDARELTRAADLWDLTSVARVNLNLPGVIYRMLDQGAQGIVVPHVNTAEEARAVVDASKFHPLGQRGFYLGRQAIGVEDYPKVANDETLVVVLIEDIVAINNLAEILEVDNIDVFMVAPGDLAQTMGYPGQPAHPEVKAVVDQAFEQIIKRGRVTGTVALEDDVEDLVAKGVQLLMAHYRSWMASGAQRYLDVVNQAVK